MPMTEQGPGGAGGPDDHAGGPAPRLGLESGEMAEAAEATLPAPARPEVPYGEWESPITSADVAAGAEGLGFPAIAGGDIWWQESLPRENGRVTVMYRAAGGKLAPLLPAPWNARTRVHEYGGRSYLPVPLPARAPGRGLRSSKAIVFAHFDDQRLYL